MDTWIVASVIVASLGLAFGMYQWLQRRGAENRTPEIRVTSELTVKSVRGDSEPWIVGFKIRVTNTATKANEVRLRDISVELPDSNLLTGYALDPARRAGQGPWVAGHVKVPEDALGGIVGVPARRSIEGHVHFLVRVGVRDELTTSPVRLSVEDMDGRQGTLEVEPGRSINLKHH